MWITHYFSVYAYRKIGNIDPFLNTPILLIYILTFVITISLFIFFKREKGKLENNEEVILFTACVGLTTFNYFLGRPFLSSLNTLSLPLIICIFYPAKVFLDKLRFESKAISLSAIILISTLLSIPATLFAYQGINNLKLANPYTTFRILKHQMPQVKNEYDWVGPTAQALKAKYGTETRSGNLTIISAWDTWFLVIYRSTNRAGINCLICYYFPADDLDFVIENIKKSPSQYLFVDSKSTFEDGRDKYLFSKLKDQYSYVETIGFLDVYKRYGVKLILY